MLLNRFVTCLALPSFAYSIEERESVRGGFLGIGIGTG